MLSWVGFAPIVISIVALAYAVCGTAPGNQPANVLHYLVSLLEDYVWWQIIWKMIDPYPAKIYYSVGFFLWHSANLRIRRRWICHVYLLLWPAKRNRNDGKPAISILCLLKLSSSPTRKIWSNLVPHILVSFHPYSFATALLINACYRHVHLSREKVLFKNVGNAFWSDVLFKFYLIWRNRGIITWVCERVTPYFKYMQSATGTRSRIVKSRKFWIGSWTRSNFPSVRTIDEPAPETCRFLPLVWASTSALRAVA